MVILCISFMQQLHFSKSSVFNFILMQCLWSGQVEAPKCLVKDRKTQRFRLNGKKLSWRLIKNIPLSCTDTAGNCPQVSSNKCGVVATAVAGKCPDMSEKKYPSLQMLRFICSEWAVEVLWFLGRWRWIHHNHVLFLWLPSRWAVKIIFDCNAAFVFARIWSLREEKKKRFLLEG